MNRRIAFVAAALALTLGGLPLLAQQGPGSGFGPGPRGGGPGRGPGAGPMGLFPGLAQVGLTDAQREQIHSTMEAQRQTAGNPAEKVRQAEEALRTALLADAPDQQAIDAAKAALNSAHTAELDLRVQLMARIAAILTPAQRQQLAQTPPPPRDKPYI